MKSGTGDTAAITSFGANEGSSASRFVIHAPMSVHRHASSAVGGNPIVMTPSTQS